MFSLQSLFCATQNVLCLFFLQHACCGRNSSSSWGESLSVLSLQVMRLLVRNSGLSHGSKLFYVTTETLFPKCVSRGLGRAQHSARESELIAVLGAGPGSNNPSLLASLTILRIALEEAGCGYVAAATSELTTIPINQGAFLPEPLCAGPGCHIRLCHQLFVHLWVYHPLVFKEFFIQTPF